MLEDSDVCAQKMLGIVEYKRPAGFGLKDKMHGILAALLAIQEYGIYILHKNFTELLVAEGGRHFKKE
ncbi:hypothetical protein [Peribacillus glennii]|uniref:hypothetical protein n=1 Tax=Peribacillus glennii TaxID=2303991 RepID=UPI001F17CA9C|nr:hypothetical protein [Peribacillus glennii]